ncbi:pro-neuregulin-1, membrane-bound isoform isoform X3 [Denticeps clupeoides]|uniref:Pro-neuregulin-1, membrane-bound isoform n=1 Tax=Denticeps clupeoides TaxID=299321 RepID=A0AAY4E2G4_9TELE|nr:pro-neuregulin-1, membrane-bound isoform isoform X3 [Denticeps clupeoides]
MRPRGSFALSALCGILASFSVSPQGARCSGLPCRPAPAASVQELVHRSGVVLEGKLQEEGRERDMNQDERDLLLQQRARRTAPTPHQVRVRVHQVWGTKAGGLEKDSVISLLWHPGDTCLALSADTRYMFFMEPTNDTSVFLASFPPIETRRSVRKDISKVLCQECAEPKLKPLRNKTVDEGRKVTLTCEIEAGSPLPKFKWYKNGKEIPAKKSPNLKIKKKKGGKVSELQFKSATLSDIATYTCEAINKLGKVSTSGNLTVITAATSTTPSLKTSSHVARCSDSEKSYCVNGGECFTLELTPGTTKFLCRCPRGYTGNRCQATVPVRVIKPKQAEELYQKRVLTITGICIALLVVGIMCVVAYCKTKKQRKKLHDRLRQSLRERSAMAGMASGPQIPHPPPESLQLVNQYVSQNAVPAQHVIEKETETSFSTSQCTTSTNQSSMTTHPSSQSWSNGKNESMSSESRSVLVMSSAEGSRQGTPSHRGRLNGTGGTHDLGAYLRNTRDMADSHRNSPYSERYVSAMTTPTRLSPVELLPPGSPLSPPSEVSSAPFSSLAMSVPSMAMSPSGEEERPLLFASPPQLRDKQRMCHSGASQQCSRNSAHYNHGQDDASLPPSPLHIVEDDEYGSTQEYDAVATVTAGTTASQPPLLQSPSYNNKLPNGQPAGKRTKCNGTAASATTPTTALQGGGEVASESISERSSSEESETEDERVGEDTPFLNLQNPLAIGILELSTAALLPADASRTNPALRLSPQDDLQTRLSSVMANQDPIAV